MLLSIILALIKSTSPRANNPVARASAKAVDFLSITEIDRIS